MLDTANGDITGTPTAANPLNFTAQVVDSSGSANGTVSDSCTINMTTTPYVCTIPPSGTQIGGGGTSWNNFNPQGSTDVVAINMHIGTPSGVPTNQVTTVQFTGVSFVLNGRLIASGWFPDLRSVGPGDSGGELRLDVCAERSLDHDSQPE